MENKEELAKLFNERANLGLPPDDHEYEDYSIAFIAGYEAGAKAASGEARIRELEEALRFYAAEWGSAVNDELIRQGGFFPYDANDYDQVKDGGKIARQALSGAGKGEGHE